MKNTFNNNMALYSDHFDIVVVPPQPLGSNRIDDLKQKSLDFDPIAKLKWILNQSNYNYEITGKLK